MSSWSEKAKLALVQALDNPGLASDAARCRHRIVWQYTPAQGEDESGQLLLWAGSADGDLIELKSSAGVLQEVLSRLPKPGYQSLGALRRQVGGFAVDAKELALLQALPFIERLLDGWRLALSGNAHPAKTIDHSGLAAIRGRYVALSNANADWVYTEEVGDAQLPPLLMLHTAGADARQWHGLMSMPDLQSEWNVHAFDLPAHGRSPMPSGAQGRDWHLSEAQYLEWIMAYLDAAGLHKVALMGCSMGAAIGLALLAKFPERFLGGILLETPYHSPGRRSAYLNHPEVHGARLASAWVGSLLSPTSAPDRRALAGWIYAQGAPGIYDGDLAFYSDAFHASQHTGLIDCQATPLCLLTGDYDYSASPQDTMRVAAEIAQSSFTTLAGFGHFPMVENPQGLWPYLVEPLRAMRSRAGL